MLDNISLVDKNIIESIAKLDQSYKTDWKQYYKQVAGHYMITLG
jgi:hypothetical protein